MVALSDDAFHDVVLLLNEADHHELHLTCRRLRQLTYDQMRQHRETPSAAVRVRAQTFKYPSLNYLITFSDVAGCNYFVYVDACRDLLRVLLDFGRYSHG